MKKTLLVIALFALLIPSVLSETKIFSGKILTDTDKALDEGIFRFIYDEKSNKVLVKTPATNLIISNGECDSNSNFKVCINSANFSYRDDATFLRYYDIDVTIYKSLGSLDAKKAASLTTLLQGQQSELTFTITNPTEFEISGVDYRENISGFAVDEVKGCKLEGDSIYWSGTIGPYQDKICIVKIVAQKEGTYNIVGNLTYFNTVATESKKTDALKIAVLPKQLGISHSIDADIEVGIPFFLNLSFNNLHNEEKIEFSAKIFLPDGIGIIKKQQGIIQDGNKLSISTALEPKTYSNYSLYLQADSESKTSISLEADYFVKIISDKIEKSVIINAVEPKPLIDFLVDPQKLTPGKKFIIQTKMTNPSRYYEIANIKAELSVPYNDGIVENVNKLNPNETRVVTSNTFVIPLDTDVEKNDTLNANMRIEYYLASKPKSANYPLELKIARSGLEEETAEEKNKLNQQKEEVKVEQDKNATKEASQQQTQPQSQQPISKASSINLNDALVFLAVVSVFIVAIAMFVKNLRNKNEP